MNILINISLERFWCALFEEHILTGSLAFSLRLNVSWCVPPNKKSLKTFSLQGFNTF